MFYKNFLFELMKKIIFLTFIILFFFVSSFNLMAKKNKYISIPSEANLPLSNRLDNLLSRYGEKLNIGIAVENLKTGQVLYKRNADRYFTPASNEKLFTAFAALHYLGPNFTYQTRLYADQSKISNNTLDDNIYIQFAGDPTLTLTRLSHLVKSLSQAGIQHIKGTLIIDDSLFDQASIIPGLDDEDKYYCFASPISASMVNRNCMVVSVKPASQTNLPAQLILPGHLQYMPFSNHVITGPAKKKDCSVGIKAVGNTFVLDGCIKKSAGAKGFAAPVYNPRAYTRSIMLYLLKKNQIVLDRDIVFRHIDSPPPLLATEESKPLHTLIHTMLKDSDNIIANAIFKTIGAYYSQQAASWANSGHAVNSILTKYTPQKTEIMSLVDGAGNSKFDHVTPQQIVTLLKKAYSFEHSPMFISSLPISGTDGTLRYRMGEAAYRGRVRAKTGTESGVTALSGYINARSGQTLVFAILINGFDDARSKYKMLEDRICTTLIEAN